jgi:hypothetical protein
MNSEDLIALLTGARGLGRLKIFQINVPIENIISMDNNYGVAVLAFEAAAFFRGGMMKKVRCMSS